MNAGDNACCEKVPSGEGGAKVVALPACRQVACRERVAGTYDVDHLDPFGFKALGDVAGEDGGCPGAVFDDEFGDVREDFSHFRRRRASPQGRSLVESGKDCRGFPRQLYQDAARSRHRPQGRSVVDVEGGRVPPARSPIQNVV